MKKIFGLLMTGLFLFSAVGCSNGTNAVATPAPTATTAAPTEAPTQKESLTIGVMGSVDAIPIIMAKEKGYYDEQNVEVTIEVFQNSKDRDAALQAGKLDGIIGDQIAMTMFQNADLDLKITGITDGQFALVTTKDSGITSIDQVKGKKVAISENTIIDFSLDTLLEKNDMVTTDVVREIVPPLPTRLELLRGGQVDAALLPDPFASLIIKEGGVLLDNIDPSNMYVSVTAFKQDTIDTKPEAIKNFYKAYDQAVDYLNATPIAEYEDSIISIVGYPEDMKGSIVLPTFRKNQLPATEELETVIAWSKNKGLLTKELAPADMLSNVGVE